MMPVRRVLAGLVARLDGLAMVGLAGFMGWLVLRGDYWLFLNPKFKPVTLTAAGLLLVLGGYAAWRPVSRPNLGRLLCYVVLGAMVGLTEGGTQAFSQAAGSGDPFMVCPAPLPAPPRPAVPDHLTAGGQDFIPINTGELYDIAAKGHGKAWDTAYAMRGFVYRAPDLDAKGEFVLYRLAIWCCFADSTAVGFRVRPPEGTPLPEKGQWLVVLGRLADAPTDERREYALPGIPFSSISPVAVFAAVRLDTATPAPEEVNMFEWRQAPPYAY